MTEIATDPQLDNEVWHRVPSLANSSPEDRHFVLNTDENGTTTLRFGDGIHGARLPGGPDRVAAAYISSNNFVAVVLQQGRLIVDVDAGAGGICAGRLCGLYRGAVTNNVDPMSQLRVQVQFTAVLENKRMWAVPCRPVGSATVPTVGASVWVSFEEGNPSLPVWIGIV